MTCCERDDLIALRKEEGIGADKQRADALLHQSNESCLQLSFGTSSQNNESQPQHMCSRSHISQLFFRTRKIRIHERRECGATGNELAQQSQLL